MGHVQCCLATVSGGKANVLFVVIESVKAFVTQLLSQRQISLSGTIKYIVSYCIILCCILRYVAQESHLVNALGNDTPCTRFMMPYCWSCKTN